jgi:hypothetical protein
MFVSAGQALAQSFPPELYPESAKAISSLTTPLAKKHLSEVKLARSLFHKAHRKFLRNYEAYATVNDAFGKGNYDCLSGTYILSQALTNLNIRHRIIETNYHVFLIAETNRGEVLLESTDRYGGFVTDPKMIEEKINNYRTNRSGRLDGQLYLSHIKIYHEILPVQLSGLVYFNLAVQSYHKNELTASCQYLQSAWKIYDNPRIDEFSPILSRSVMKSDLDEDQKARLTGLLKSHTHHMTALVANK